jgi:hypothetical protein
VRSPRRRTSLPLIASQDAGRARFLPAGRGFPPFRQGTNPATERGGANVRWARHHSPDRSDHHPAHLDLLKSGKGRLVLSTAGLSPVQAVEFLRPLSAICEEDVSIHPTDVLPSRAAAGSRLSRSWGRSPLSPRMKPGPPSPGFPLSYGFTKIRRARRERGGTEVHPGAAPRTSAARAPCAPGAARARRAASLAARARRS